MGVAAVLDAEDVDDLAEGDELGEDPRELEELVLREANAQVVPERIVHGVVIGEELIGVTKGGLLAIREGSTLVVSEGHHQLLRDALSPSQGVARGHSLLALVELGESEAASSLVRCSTLPLRTSGE